MRSILMKSLFGAVAAVLLTAGTASAADVARSRRCPSRSW